MLHNPLSPPYLKGEILSHPLKVRGGWEGVIKTDFSRRGFRNECGNPC